MKVVKESALILTDEPITLRNQFGKYAVYLAFVTVFISFAGFGILGQSMMNLFVSIGSSFPGTGFPTTFPSPDFLLLQTVMMSMMGNLAIKMFAGFMGPVFGSILIRNQRRSIASIYFVAIGIVTMIPIIIGGPEVFEIVFSTIGILPFIPHMICGMFCLTIAVLVGLWMPAPGGLGVESVTRPVAHTYSSPTGTQPKCPNCGHGLFGDERYCPGCAYDLRLK